MDEAPGLFRIEETTESSAADSRDEAHLRLLAGKKADYYLTQWEERLRGRSNRCGFNKAAFFLAGLWVGYRKMYGVAFILWLAVALEAVVSDVVFVEILGREDAPTWYDRLGTLFVAWLCGYFGNRWYFLHCQRKLEKARGRGLVEGDGLEVALRSEGGTSVLSSIVVTLLGFGMAFGVFFVYAIVMDAINGV